MVRIFFLLTCFSFVPVFAEDENDDFGAWITDDNGKTYDVQKVCSPDTYQEIRDCILSAKGSVAVAGSRYSQGGQIVSDYVVDMQFLNHLVDIDTKNKVLTMQTGATWSKIQEIIHPLGLSIKIMQPFSDFTVGGSLSVNAHGRYRGLGPIIESVRSIKIMLADGSIRTASRTENQDLFRGAIGGYGALGIILEATIDLVENIAIEKQTAEVTLERYPEYFEKMIRNDDSIVIHGANIYPADFNQVELINWHTSKNLSGFRGKLKSEGFLNQGFIEALNRVLPKNSKMFSTFDRGKVVSRNYEANSTLKGIKSLFKKQAFRTYLQEYFIPVGKFKEFTAKLSEVLAKYNAKIEKISITHIPKNSESVLAWSREECFAFTLNYNEPLWDQRSSEKWGAELINLAIDLGGTFYLPYQNFATIEQFQKAYPNAAEFFALKRKVDPDFRFSNELWKKFYRP